jgi:hypothetical protein
MEGAQVLLELALVLLLGITLFHALRLERALGVLKRDRAVLEELVAGFNESTRAAEAGIERLRSATDGAGRQIARQIEQAQRLRDDLGFLTERGDRLAERLEGGVRSARMFADQQGISGGLGGMGHGVMGQPGVPPGAPPQMMVRPAPLPLQGSQPGGQSAGQNSGQQAGQYVGQQGGQQSGYGQADLPPLVAPEANGGPRLRSEAERELLRALRAAR